MRWQLPQDALTPVDPLGFPIDTDRIEWLPSRGAGAVDADAASDRLSAALFDRIGTLTDAHFGPVGMNALHQTGLQYFGTPEHMANVAGHAAIGV